MKDRKGRRNGKQLAMGVLGSAGQALKELNFSHQLKD
jgi:hypothetical protein